LKRALFVTNGHGEAAIADRIAFELRPMVPGAQLDHLALVAGAACETMRDVGPRREMPSGGLIAMGNVRNLARDVRAGLIGLTNAQYRFLRDARGSYDVALAVGDAYALAMTLAARAPTIFVGTAKSVAVAPYGALERRLLRGARARFVRDEPTARALRECGLEVEPAANVIVDIFAAPDDPAAASALAGFLPRLALLPGSRESAYGDARLLLAVTREVAARHSTLGAALSVAPGLQAGRFAADARRDGWDVRETDDDMVPFVLSVAGREIVRGWRGALGPLLSRAELVLGQAGTANEAAAAAGVPVVAFEPHRKSGWYRKRQRALLGEALAVLPSNLDDAVAGVDAILDDAGRRRTMGARGRERMGTPGAARRVAERAAALLRGGT